MSEPQEAPPDTSEPPAPSTTEKDSSNAAKPEPRPSSLPMPKPSGLKPPSKIGRLCSNAAPKPAVPASPRTDGSSETLRKLSDDSRKHLSDLIEDEEDGVTSSVPDRPRSYRKVSTSSGSMVSMDALWEKHPRRLSEAGLRRSSDHSVVLTEDTDSFIIGERVWVGGTKSGQIAYIGETQFAPGDWAGIVLDDPIGKNDGSVAGVRYFQCAEKRGVFSRLTRLTRVPLMSHAPHDTSPVSDGSVFERPPSGAGYTRSRRTLSPNGSVRSAFSNKMNTSVSTTSTSELRMGDRVIVSSSRGSKAGILRYVGVTDFAPGVWAGVELDDPIGKNDGSVEGKSYFQCAPRFGLFAPISKVSRSPSNRKPGQCAIHNNGRQTPIRRSNSRESLTSLGTSIASSRVTRTGLGVQRYGAPRAASTPVSAKNALQELLREKQHHLERLMRERELERSEVAKVSMQAERAETALANLRKDTEQSVCENSTLKSELERLKQQLEDERQKVEDLMFRNEEENINKEDYVKYKEQMENEKAACEKRIRELEAEAALQSARAEANASALRALEDQRSAEAAALAEQHREELTAAQTLASELQKLLDEAYALLKEKECEKDSLGKSMSEELTKVKAEYEKALNDAKTKIAIAQTEFETQLSVVSAKLQLAESKLEAEKLNVERLNKDSIQTITELNAKVSQLQATVDDKTLELNKVMGSSKEHEVNLNKEITKLKMELSAKVLDMEQIEDAKKKQQVTCQELKDEINRIKEEYSTKVNEYESILTEVSQQNEKNKMEILTLQQNLQAKTKDYERLLSDSSSTSESTEKLITEFKQTIHERDKEIIKLKDDYEKVSANFNIKHSKIAEEHKKEIEDRNAKIEQLMKEIENHKSAIDKSKIDFDTLNTQFSLNANELNTLKDENDRLKQTITELIQANNDLKAKISTMELEIGELKRQYSSTVEKCEEIQKAKDKIESEYMNLTGQATDSNDQYNKLSQHLKDTEKELNDMKDKHRESVNNHARIEQEMKQTLLKLQEDFAAERTQLVRSVDDSMDKLLEADKRIKELEAQGIELNKRLTELDASRDKLLDENSILKKDIEAMKIKEQEIITEHEAMRKKLEIEMDKYKEEINILNSEGATSEVKLMEKVDQLTEAQNDLNNKLEEARKHEDSLQKILDDTTAQLNTQRTQFENDITQAQNQLVAVTQECHNHKLEEIRLKEQLQEKQNNVKDLTLKLEMLEVDLKSNGEIITEKDRQIAQINVELLKTTENKKELEDKLNNLIQEANSVKQQYENLLSNSSAEGSMLQEQLVQVETLKGEMSALVQNKTALESKYNEVESELSQLKEEHKRTVEKLNNHVNVNNEIMITLTEKDAVLKSQTEKSETVSLKLKSLEEDISRLKQDIIQKDTAIHENELQLAKLNESLTSGTSETQQIIAQLQTENYQLTEKYKIEIERSNNTTKQLQKQVTEQEKQLEELKQTKEKLTQLQELLAKSDSDIKQLTNINEGQKSNYEEINKQLQIQFDEYRKEAKRTKHDLKARIELNEKELQESREKIKTEVEKQNQLQEKLTDAEKNILDLSQKLELITVQQSSNAEKDSVLEKLTLDLQATRKSSADALKNSETVVDTLKQDVHRKVKELKQKDELLSKLQKELDNQKAKAEVAEREIVHLQKQYAENNKDVRDKNDNKPIGVLGQGDVSQKLQEEKEIIDGQVSFLNAVIVDMQRKNEQLVARVQALEAGEPSESPVFANGRKPRAAPRLFCDICDVFDAHDTEDCPRQTSDAAPPAARKPPPAPRPYCDICEVFGHSTENCDEEETF